MPDLSAENLLQRLSQLEGDRKNYESFWQDLAKYCLPRKSYITRTRTPGDKYDYDLYDSTAMQATLVLAAGLHSYLTNPASKWFALKTIDRSKSDSQDVKDWLRDSEDKVYDTLNSSNFAQQIHETYIDLAVFGTACLYEEEDPNDVVRFYPRPISEVYIAEDERERVDTVYRKFKLTARQAYQKWGEDAGEEVVKAMERKEFFKQIDFVHCVMPRHERDVVKEDNKNMPWLSRYIEISKRRDISDGGYLEFPFFVPRFNKHNDDAYGSSPAMVSYPDIKQLNEMCKTVIRAAQKIVDPPLVLPHDGFLLPIKLGAGAINYKVKRTVDDRIEPLITGGNLPVGMEMEQERREIIKRNFFVDLFLLLADQKNMTATEVAQRVEEKMLILAPTLGRLMSELLEPIITRTLYILFRAGRLKPIPMSLQGQDFGVEYTSPLARAQRLEEMKSINNVVAIVGNIAQVIPEILDNINADELVKNVADIHNTNPKILRSDEEVQALRQARADSQKAQMMASMAQQGADIGKTLSEAKKNAEPAVK